jgi:hypothetical protein
MDRETMNATTNELIMPMLGPPIGSRGRKCNITEDKL